MRVAVTGADGFLGRHVSALLRSDHAHEILPVTRDTPPEGLRAALLAADAVIHLAGVNRPRDESEFTTGNTDFTRTITQVLEDGGRNASVAFASSTRATEDTPYGRSKLAAESILRDHAARHGVRVAVFRFPNVFGKWSRPFYNSAVATFCHSVARDLPVDVHDPARRLTLVYGEDAARAMVEWATDTALTPGGFGFQSAGPEYEVTLGGLVELIRAFRAMRTTLRVPDLSDAFTRALYGTYVSFLPPEQVSYALTKHVDERGALAELLKSPQFGQVFISRTKPGITRGNHFHHTKTEKFVVVDGEAVIRMRPIDGGGVTEVRVSGDEFRVVDIPTGQTHSITNVGSTTLVTLFWASEIFDPQRPDTYFLEV